jgi:hypothetical protein
VSHRESWKPNIRCRFEGPAGATLVGTSSQQYAMRPKLAGITNTIACDHHDWFRGFAPIAGGGPSACADNVNSAIMIHHGTADEIVDLSSGEGSRDFCVEQNGCAQTSSSSYTGCESYDGCPDETPVVWCVGNFEHTINSTTVGNIWSFFSGLE